MNTMPMNTQNALERIFKVIQANPGQLCAADLRERFDTELVYRGLASLRHRGKITAKKGFGKNGVVWLYYPA